MTKPRDTFQFAEFFAGIGLMRMGLENASNKFSCVFANDLDPKKKAMYTHHFGQDSHEFNDKDVHQLSAQDIPTISLATASFPCTDLSLAGGRAGVHKGESSAFWGFYNILNSMNSKKPNVVLLENVVGLLSSNNGDDFEDVLRAMNQIGYSVDPFILDAKWFVPQSRARMFVVCSLENYRVSQSNLPPDESRIRPAKLIEFITKRFNDIRWQIRDLPDPPPNSTLKLNDIVQDPDDDSADWWNEERVEYILNQMFDRHLSWIQEHLNNSHYSYATAFRRVRPYNGTKKSMAELRTDGIAGCLRTPKGGSGRQILFRVGHGRISVRLLSPSECATLMGASDFRVSGTTNQALFGFGDAVCVDAVSWIAKNAILPLLRQAETHNCGYCEHDDRHTTVST